LGEFSFSSELRSGATAASAAAQGEEPTPIMKRPAFWLLSLGIGIVAGAGTGFVVHIVPYGLSQQMSLQSASALLSVYAGAGVGGTVLFGWICDRIGPPAALAFGAIAQALLWSSLLYLHGPAMYLVAALLGICVVPLVTLQGAAISHLFDTASVSRAMGYSYFIQLPFILVFGPALGLLFDHFGQYNVPFLIVAAFLVLAGLLFYVMILTLRRQRSSLSVAAAS